MPDNFEFTPNNKIDISQIRNTRIIEQNKRTRKELPFSLHLVMAIAAAICIYLASDGLSLGIPLTFVLSGICLGPILAMYIFLNSPIYLKLAVLLIPVAGIGAKALLPGNKNVVYLSGCLFVYLLCISVSAILMKTSISGYSKNNCFLLITAAYLIITLCTFAFLLIYYNGGISVSIITKTIDDFFNKVSKESSAIMSSEDFIRQIRAMLPAAASYTDEELLKILNDAIQTSISTVKAILPGIVILSCMALSFLTVELFTLFAKIFKIDVFVCIMDDFWTYRPSHATTIMYDIVFFAYVIDIFAPLPSNISAAINNLILIMAASMSVLGVKAVYSFFRKRKVRHFLCALITLGIVSGVVLMTGTLGILVLSSLGVMYVTMRNREEISLLPLKLAEDRNAFSDAQETDTDSRNDSEDN